MTSKPSASLAVMIDNALSAVIWKLVSTTLPEPTGSPSARTLPANAALAKPAPMEAATSATVTGPGNSRLEPSGSVM